MTTLNERERAIAVHKATHRHWREIVERGRLLRKIEHAAAMSQELARVDEQSQRLRTELEQHERAVFAAKGEVEAVRRQLDMITAEISDKEQMPGAAHLKELSRLTREISTLRTRMYALLGDELPLEAA